MAKFKVGDIVRIKKDIDVPNELKLCLGYTGIVKDQYDLGDKYKYNITLSHPLYIQNNRYEYEINQVEFTEDELELVEPKFKIGDKVVVSSCNDDTPKPITRIIWVNSRESYEYQLEKPDVPRWRSYMNVMESDLSKVEQ